MRGTVLSKSHHQVFRVYNRPTLGTAADFERTELDIVGFALIGDVDALDSCGGRTTIDSSFAATVSC